MIEMIDVVKVYRTGVLETVALRNFNLYVPRGEFVSIMGPSGSGKTTFLNVAGLLDTFEEGTYKLDGRDASKLSDREMSRLRNKKIGFIFQSFNLLPDLDVYDNVDVPLRYRGMRYRERRRKIEEVLDKVGLASKIHHRPSQLSGGQQQRVAIARALVGEPEVLLADEPTGNVDSVMARQIVSLLEDINEQGTTIIMVTHDPQIAARASRRIHILDGKAIDNQPQTQQLKRD